MLEWAQSGLMEVRVRVASGPSRENFVVLSPTMRIKLAKACANFFAPKLVAKWRATGMRSWALSSVILTGSLRSHWARCLMNSTGKNKRGDDFELCQPQEPKRVA